MKLFFSNCEVQIYTGTGKINVQENHQQEIFAEEDLPLLKTALNIASNHFWEQVMKMGLSYQDTPLKDIEQLLQKFDNFFQEEKDDKERAD